MNWDNLRYFLEVARTGRLTVAARRLGVNHTTVSRRIQALEKQMEAKLFVRDGIGYAMTEAGRLLLSHAEAMESACLTIEHTRPDEGQQLSGLVRVGATEGFGSTVLAPNLALFAERHPHLEIDLLAVPRLVNLSRREADIVITLERPTRGPFIITKLTNYVLKLYASRAYLAKHAPIASRDDLRQHAFISYIDDLLFSKELHYLDEICPSPRTVLRSTSIVAQHYATVAGGGLAILPSFMAAQDPALQVVLPDQVEVGRSFWMLMHTEVKDLARIRAVWEFLKEVAATRQDLLLGKVG